jgi:hypothetical protein
MDENDLESYIERFTYFICWLNENITYFELNNVYAAGEEYQSDLKLKSILIKHQYHPRPFFIA